MAVVVRSGTLVGVDGEAVAVEVDLLRRLPAVVVVGLASAAVRESADRRFLEIDAEERED